VKDAFFDVPRVKAAICDRYRKEYDGTFDGDDGIFVRVLIGRTWVTVDYCGDKNSGAAAERARRAVWLIAAIANKPRASRLWSVDGLFELDDIDPNPNKKKHNAA